jgi:hypothetical protein
MGARHIDDDDDDDKWTKILGFKKQALNVSTFLFITMVLTNSAECGIRNGYVELNIATSGGSCECVAALPVFIQGWQFLNTRTTETDTISTLLSSVLRKARKDI